MGSAKEAKFQPLSQSDNDDDINFDEDKGMVHGNDPKSLLDRFLGSSKKRDGDPVNWEDIGRDVLKFL